MSLRTLGWSERWKEIFAPFAAESLLPARVLVEHKGMYTIGTGTTEVRAEVAGRLRHEAVRRSEFPAVGDFVAYRPSDGSGPAIIRAVLPRRSAFIRKAAGQAFEEQVVAANIDTVFIMTALDRDFNLRRLERYLTLAWESGATPVILLNKADLSDEIIRRMDEVAGVTMGVPTHVVSALTGQGLENLERYLLPRQTIGVLGSSGVGKSTLINRLLARHVQATRAVRADDHRGRHTTTHRQLFVCPGGALIIDTPGMRELQLWHADEGLETTFQDIETLATQCRFHDCQHVNEPGCAVLAAVKRGALDAERLASFRKLARELRYTAALDDKDAMLARKRHAKIANKAMKEFKKR
jgi:ribosome biogenesis GTPase / thiamine phosphate phosphatase